MYRVLLIGKSGRIDCIADAVVRSRYSVELYALSEVMNPSLARKAKHVEASGQTDDISHVRRYAQSVRPNLAIIGPEEPLAAGIVDMLTEDLRVPCVGPTKNLAQLESSKSFTRRLLDKYGIPGNPRYAVFSSLEGIREFLEDLDGFVVKPDVLTGGKGVKVQGDHLHSIDEALHYCKVLLEDKRRPCVVIEEKLDGEEFSLQSFCDGKHVVDTVVVQDHKRAAIHDKGPNTGGMGSYSCADHRLPFLSDDDIQKASDINHSVAKALAAEFRNSYHGILYGGFMVTKDGLRLIEYNVRFGDPEVMNVLPILKADFIEVCQAIISGHLDQIEIEFENKSTVCKYLVPHGYPDDPVRNQKLDKATIPKSSESLRVYFGAVNETPDGDYVLKGSRAIACVGIAESLSDAEAIAERAASSIRGPVTYRTDIGTGALINSRVEHMERIRGVPLYG